MIDCWYLFHFLTSRSFRSRRGQTAIQKYQEAAVPCKSMGQTAIQKYQEAAVPCKSMGQTAIEYLLMLALIAGLAVILGMLFNRRLLGGFFSIVGMIIGEGLGKT